MLSQLEVDMLKRTASSDLYQLFRNCSLAVLNSGSLTDNSKELIPATGQHTWQFGLTRMLLGYAMESAQGEWQSVLPYDESSGLIA
ncbi:exodeoxyribonuclease V subunit gamma, partial [Salmonella enterica subsp. enterica serovar Anatum]|nr:exodeoxyribonuclease V subunit gamma [Salmonella enterica subsp. enterica serovar Anatum]